MNDDEVIQHRRALLKSILLGVVPGLMPGSEARAATIQTNTLVNIIPAQTTWPDPPASVPVKEGMADLPGVKLWYWDTGGSGEPVVLLHPGTGSAAIWEYQQPVLARAGYRVIGYSRRSHYRSESGSPQDKGTGAGDLYNLAEFLGLKKFHLVGSAAGGFIAADFALSYPERLLSLVMACTQGGIADPELQAIVKTLSQEGFLALPSEFKELGPSYRAANPNGVERWVSLERTSAVTPRVNQAKLNTVSLEKLGALKTPTLFVMGDADLYSPPALMRRIAARMPTSETIIISESGHSAYWEQPEAFNKALLDFFARHQS